MSSLALLAAGAPGDGEVAAAVTGGHGELFVQQFDGDHVEPTIGAAQPAARRRGRGDRRAGWSSAPAPRRSSTARGWGEARDALAFRGRRAELPSGSCAVLAPKPVYARAPDARAREAA